MPGIIPKLEETVLVKRKQEVHLDEGLPILMVYILEFLLIQSISTASTNPKSIQSYISSSKSINKTNNSSIPINLHS